MTRPLRILLSLPYISRAGGGVSESARLQVAALQETGETDISVLCFDDANFNRDRQGWKTQNIGSFRTFGPRSYGFSPGLLLAILRSRPDIIHVHGVWQFHCAAVYLWSLITGRPYIVTPHGMLEPWIRARSSRLKKLVSWLYQNRFLKRAAAFQLLTQKERSDVEEFLIGNLAEIIPNYVPPFIREQIAPGWWRDNLTGRDIYLFLGRIHEKKGCMELCDAWEKLCTEDNHFKEKSALVFCGWNDGLTGFEERVEALGIQYGNAIFAGPQYGAEKARTLSRAHFFILPSKSEGLPMAVLEAWAADIPVIMTEACNLSASFKLNAAIRTESEVVAIANVLSRTSQLSNEERLGIAKRAKSLVEINYSANSVRQALLQLYHHAMVYREKRR